MIFNVIEKYLKSIRHEEKLLPVLDPSTSHYNFRSYLECCYSLGITPSIAKFVRYNTLYKNNFKS